MHFHSARYTQVLPQAKNTKTLILNRTADRNSPRKPKMESQTYIYIATILRMMWGGGSHLLFSCFLLPSVCLRQLLTWVPWVGMGGERVPPLFLNCQKPVTNQ